MPRCSAIFEVSLCQLLSLSGMVGPLWDLCECQVEFGNVLQRSMMQIYHFLLCINSIQTRV